MENAAEKSGQRVLLSIVGEDLSSVHDQWGLECWHAPPANVRPCFYIYVRYVNKNLSLFATSSKTANKKKTEKKTALSSVGWSPVGCQTFSLPERFGDLYTRK